MIAPAPRIGKFAGGVKPAGKVRKVRPPISARNTRNTRNKPMQGIINRA